MQRLIIVLMLLLPALTSAQSEQEQKLQKRAERNQPTTTPSQSDQPVYVTPTYVPQTQFWPYRPQPVYNRPRYRDWYYDDSSEYTGKSQQSAFDIQLSLGFSLAVSVVDVPSVFGLYAALGSSNFQIYGGWGTSTQNPYPHYPNITLEDVISWNDEFHSFQDQVKSIPLGARIKHANNLYHIIGINIIDKQRNLVYRDELNILTIESDDNLYTIIGNQEQWTNLTIGQGIVIDQEVELNIQLHFPRQPSIQASIGITL